jgi:hypothetical protein
VKRPLCHAVVSILLLVPSAVRVARADSPAAPTDDQKAAARLLGTDGVRLAMSGDCRNAVDKLTRAEALVHAPTTAVPLAKCQIQLGKIVAGTEILNRLLNETLPANAPEPWVEARRQVQPMLDAASPRIGRLRIHVDRPAGSAGDVQVTVDGEPMPSVLLDNDRPTDPGAHHVAAKSQGLSTAEADVSLAEGQSRAVSLQLEALPGGPAPLAAAPATEATAVAVTPAPTAPASGPSTNHVPAYVSFGVGAAGVVVGSIFGIMALSTKSTLDNECGGDKSNCPASNVSALDRNALVSTLGWGVGIVGAALGAYFWFSAPPASGTNAARVDVRPWLGPGSAGVLGRF